MKYCKCGFRLGAEDNTMHCDKCDSYVQEIESEPLENGARSIPAKEVQL